MSGATVIATTVGASASAAVCSASTGGPLMIRLLTGVAAAALLVATATAAQAELQRLYVLDCGTNLGKDQSRWSPGVNEGKPIEFSDNCYLIRHSKGLLLWDTGISDAVAAMPNGLVTANGAIIQSRAKTLAAQLTDLGVKPADVTYVAVSHTHGDHVGNIGLFPTSTVLIQGAEYDWAMAGQNKPAFVDSQKIQKLAGDHDVFGDGSVTIITTPGHTPGHQSLLVKLPKTGALVLSGDAVHFQDNWTHKRVPSMNTSKDQSLASLERIAKVLADQKATLWINHDKPQSASLKYSPAYYE
jgi:glyoxylase-like metal-dependent hydrolase (beta-lactamase superfamily II)